MKKDIKKLFEFLFNILCTWKVKYKIESEFSFDVYMISDFFKMKRTKRNVDCSLRKFFNFNLVNIYFLILIDIHIIFISILIKLKILI